MSNIYMCIFTAVLFVIGKALKKQDNL
jgi:hypothetical protein